MQINEVNELCCGCSVCADTCPQRCISLKGDKEGFYKAYIDVTACIDCGKCQSVCPMRNINANKVIGAYIFASENKIYYEKSSSGGFFSHVAEYVLSKNGIVFGCGYNTDLLPVHIEISEIESLDQIRRSKYVQSKIDNLFPGIKKYLEEDRLVLFSGTPCQCSGLKNYLNKGFNNLIIIDIICHGTPSPAFYKKNIEYIESIKKKKLKKYEFRLKTGDDSIYRSYRQFEDESIDVLPFYKDAYFNEFYDCTSLNECCYKCPYSNESRVGDITIGDYEWGKKYHDQLKSFGEVNCVIVNTECGMEVLNDLPGRFIMEETNLEWIEEKNLNLIRPTVRPNYRDRIYIDINKMGYAGWVKRSKLSRRYIKKYPLIKWIISLKKYVAKNN